MSRASDFQRHEDELEAYLSRPVPSPPTVPLEERCRIGGKEHSFHMPGVQPGICGYCLMSENEFEAMRKARREAARQAVA